MTTVHAAWTPRDLGPVCNRHGCLARPEQRVLILDPDGEPQPLGADDYCETHARELAGMLKHYGPGRRGYRLEEL